MMQPTYKISLLFGVCLLISGCSPEVKASQQIMVDGQSAFLIETDAIFAYEQFPEANRGKPSGDVEAIMKAGIEAARTGQGTSSPDSLPNKAVKVCPAEYEVLPQAAHGKGDPIVFMGSDGIWVSPIYFAIRCKR